MCYAILFLKHRGGIDGARHIEVESKEALEPAIKEAMQKPECVQVDVFVYNSALSTSLITEWRSKSTLTNEQTL